LGQANRGTLALFTDAIANAARWGNKGLPGSFIEVTVEYGMLGSLILVQDQGSGFDYHAVLDKYQKGEKHVPEGGAGIRKFGSSHLHVSYHGNGNLVSIATPQISLEEALKFKPE